MRWQRLFFVFAFALSLACGLAGLAGAVSCGSSSIEKIYDAGDIVTGSVNISLDGDLKSSEISAKFLNSVTRRAGLYDFLKNQTGAISFLCSTQGCADDYASAGEIATSKNIALQAGKLIGIKLGGRNAEVTDFEFAVSSNAPSSCNNQLAIDLLDDGAIDWVNNKVIFQTCGEEIKSDCNTGEFITNFELMGAFYCEGLTLPVSSGLRITAGINVIGTPSYSEDLLKVSLYDESGAKLGAFCYLSNPKNARATCDLQYPIKEEGKYYLCVSMKEGAIETGYKLAARQSEPRCGLATIPTQGELVADYDITAHQLTYGAVGSFKLNESEFIKQGGGELVTYINDYLGNKYDKKCDNGCIVPVKFSGTSQNLGINDMIYSYQTEGGIIGPENGFYEIAKTPAKLDMNYTLLSLDKAGFKVPDIAGNYTLEIFVGATKVGEQNITVKAKQVSLINQVYPNTVAVLEPNVYVAFVDPFIDLTNATFKWDFGDGTGSKTTAENKVVKSLSNMKNYEANVEIYKAGAFVTHYDFVVEVVSPKEAINKTIEKSKGYLDKVETQIKDFPDEYASVINIDADSIRAQLTEIETIYKGFLSDADTTDADYAGLMASLIALDIPISVQKSKIVNTKFIDDLSDVDAGEIAGLFNETSVTNEDAYTNAITAWSIDDADISLSYNLVSVYYADRIDNALTEYKFRITNTNSNIVYAVIGDGKDSIIFNDEYLISPSSDALNTGVSLDLAANNELSFAVTYESDIFELPVYFSPLFSDLSVEPGSALGEPSKSNWWIILVVAVFLFAFLIVAYIFLLRYYKFKYEMFLFKNPGDLQNLMIFIRNSKEKGMNEKQIREKLAKAKWSNEQISYAFKKIKGQAIIWEPAPLKKFTEKKPSEKKSTGNAPGSSENSGSGGFFKIKK